MFAGIKGGLSSGWERRVSFFCLLFPDSNGCRAGYRGGFFFLSILVFFYFKSIGLENVLCVEMAPVVPITVFFFFRPFTRANL